VSLLEVKGLAVNYGAVCALEGASLAVGQGEIVALIGPNGAGKSTALRAIAGILPHYDGRIAAGEVTFDGRHINGLPPHKLIRLGMALVPENRHVFPTMSVIENLEMGACTSRDRSANRDALDHVLALFPRLAERKRQRAGTLSTGEQQMLALGRGLMIRPKLLLVDEPTVGLSPNFVDIVFDKLVEINKAGMSILLVEQNARMALDICHRAYVFEIGRIAFSGTHAELLDDARVKKAYLGA
jgi:branched-chain amino acid transport system ATP-binding protein